MRNTPDWSWGFLFVAPILLIFQSCDAGFAVRTPQATTVTAFAPAVAKTLTSPGTATGTIFYITDATVSGCAYDSADPSAIIQVHVYSEAGLNPVIGLAGYGCPWSSAPNYQGHGFIIQYRRPLNSVSGVNVAFLSAKLTSVTWVGGASAQHNINEFNRTKETFLYNTNNYQVGFSLKYGAALSEFYNNRVDSTMNLVTTDPGALVQTALFGNTTNTPFSGSNCVGLSGASDVYNPTQAGMECAGSGGAMIGSTIDMCSSSNGNSLCGKLSVNNPTPNDSNPDWIQYRIHYHNFYNPSGSTNYAPYEDVYGFVKYTFKSAYVQVDNQSWKTTPTTYGASFQQLPVAFLNQISSFTTDSLQMARAPSDNRDYAQSHQYPFSAKNKRWVLAQSLNHRPAVPMSSPGDFLTMAFYSAVVNSSGSTCPSRYYQGDFLGASSSSDTSWASIQDSSVFQNGFLNVVAEMDNYYQNRAILSPFAPTDSVGGGVLSQIFDTSEASGGSMPGWECNQPTSTAPVTTLAAGFFQPAGSETIYYSDGASSYCGISSWRDYIFDGGQADLSDVSHPANLPTAMANNGICASPKPFLANVYRFYKSSTGEHFFTLDYNEGVSAGFHSEGVGFQVFAQNYSGSTLIYRCYDSGLGKHFISIDAACEGKNTEGSYGYVFSSALDSNTVPLYRMYNGGSYDHLNTLNENEGLQNDYTLESILGYVI